MKLKDKIFFIIGGTGFIASQFIEKYGIDVYDVNAQAMKLDLTEKLITTAIKNFVDISILDTLDERRTMDYEFGWDEDEKRYYIEIPNGRLNIKI